jgi:Protein of unknown function (DUF3617)
MQSGFARTFLAGAAIAAAMALGSTTALAAKAPAYAGTWGTNAKQCANPQDVQDAPMAISATGYDQHETHCTFSNIKRKGLNWKMKASCSVEGDVQVEPLSLTVKAKTLIYQWGTGAAQKLVRCP